MLGDWIGSVYGLDLDTNEGTELGVTDGKVLSTTLGADKITPWKYDDTELGSLAGFTDEIAN